MTIDGKQLKDLSIGTIKLAVGILSADAAGRAKMATSYFDNTTTVADKFAAAAIGLDRLEEAVIQADGGQAFTADQSMGSNKLVALATPTADTDAANKAYVDSVASGLDVKDSVRWATDAALPANTAAGSGVGKTLTADANGALTVDGGTVLLNDRVLVKDEATAADNGIYTQTQVGTGALPYILTRAIDADEDAEVTAGMFTFVEEGTANADVGYVLTTNDPITVDTTTQDFAQFSGAGTIVAGVGLTKTGNTIDVGAASVGLVLNADSLEVDYGLVGGVTSVDAGDAAAAGVNDRAAREDHQHAVSTAAPVNVGIANAEGSATDLARSDHVHDSPAPTTGNKQMAASLTTSDNDQGTATTVAATPALDGYVRTYVNGLGVQVGDGTKVSVESYFSNDGGTTARAISAIASGDTWHWNGSVAGYELATTDIIDFDYLAF